jgi:hypothetical protein
VPTQEMPDLQGFSRFCGLPSGGRKVFLTMFARQIFPSWGQKKDSINHYYPSVAPEMGACAPAAWVLRQGW